MQRKCRCPRPPQNTTTNGLSFLPQQTTLGRQAVCTRRLHASSALRAADDIDGDRQRRKSAANPGATRRSPNGFHTGWRKVRYAPRGRALDSLLLPFFFFFLVLRRTWMRNSGANKDPFPRTNGFASLRARESPLFRLARSHLLLEQRLARFASSVLGRAPSRADRYLEEKRTAVMQMAASLPARKGGIAADVLRADPCVRFASASAFCVSAAFQE